MNVPNVTPQEMQEVIDEYKEMEKRLDAIRAWAARNHIAARIHEKDCLRYQEGLLNTEPYECNCGVYELLYGNISKGEKLSRVRRQAPANSQGHYDRGH